MGTGENGKVLNSQCGILQNRRRTVFLIITCFVATLLYWRLDMYSGFMFPNLVSKDSNSAVVESENISARVEHPGGTLLPDIVSNNNTSYNNIVIVRSKLAKQIETTKVRQKVPNLRRPSFKSFEVKNCTKIPQAPDGQRWPEEEFIHDPRPSDVRELADPNMSRVILDGSSTVELGDYIRLKIVLHDGYGKRKMLGGDLVRVWMKEDSLGASSNGQVIDNNDGSYVAMLQAMWVGEPQIRVFIISTREATVVRFKRRYICPPVLTNTAVFINGSKSIETPCSLDPEVPGYTELCNLTEINYGQPWFCGKPNPQKFACTDWEMANNILLPFDAMHPSLFTKLEKDIVKKAYTARSIPHNITIVIQIDNSNETRIQTVKPCNEVDKSLTWQATPPRGYMYNRKWQNRHCSIQLSKEQIYDCLKNTDIVFIGDSTTRQIHQAFLRLISCKTKLKHILCVNDTFNFNVIWQKHTFPYVADNRHRTYYKTFTQYMKEIESTQKTLLILHTFAHQNNYQSHVIRETLINMRNGIMQLLQRNHNVYIVIKGPHSFAMNKKELYSMWMPDRYAEIFEEIYFEIFQDLTDKVMYLDCMDITVSQENYDIHPENYIVDSFVNNILGYACPSR